MLKERPILFPISYALDFIYNTPMPWTSCGNNSQAMNPPTLIKKFWSISWSAFAVASDVQFLRRNFWPGIFDNFWGKNSQWEFPPKVNSLHSELRSKWENSMDFQCSRVGKVRIWFFVQKIQIKSGAGAPLTLLTYSFTNLNGLTSSFKLRFSQ